MQDSISATGNSATTNRQGEGRGRACGVRRADLEGGHRMREGGTGANEWGAKVNNLLK